MIWFLFILSFVVGLIAYSVYYYDTNSLSSKTRPGRFLQYLSYSFAAIAVFILISSIIKLISTSDFDKFDNRYCTASELNGAYNQVSQEKLDSLNLEFKCAEGRIVVIGLEQS